MSNSRATYTVTPLGEMLWVGVPFIALINFQEGKRKTALKSTCWVFAMLEGKLHGSVVHEPTHVALNSEYGAVTGIPMLFKQSGDGMLEYVSNVEKQVTFAYKDVHFVNPECGADGTCRLSLEALTTIAHG